MRTSSEQDLDLMCPQIIWEQEDMSKIALANFKAGFVCGMPVCGICLWNSTRSCGGLEISST